MNMPDSFRTPSGVACWSLGSGPVTIAVHGGPGMDHSLFRPALDSLGTDRQLVYFDLPGHGASAPTGNYSLDEMADVIDDVRLATGADRVTLIGSSYGGYLSLIYAIHHPDRVAAMVLVDTSASYGFRDESLETAQTRGTPAMLTALGRLWDGSLQTDDEFHEAWRTILPLYFYNLSGEQVHQLADGSSYCLETRKAILPTLHHYDVRRDLGSIDVPALVVAGRYDWITSVTQAEELAAGLPYCDLLIFEDSGHYPFIEENEAFIASVREWLGARGL
jgi:proline iminopeptidase